MQTGPLPAAQKSRVKASVSNKVSKASGVPAGVSLAPPTEPELPEPTPPGFTAIAGRSSSNQPLLPKDNLDVVSNTLVHPDSLNLAPPAIDDMSVDGEVLPATTSAPSVGCVSTIQVWTHPTLNVSTLVQTSPPALLFVDKDIRPSWLLTSIHHHLQHGPYYMCLNTVVDLFLTQESRLGYPAKVRKFPFLHSLPH